MSRKADSLGAVGLLFCLKTLDETQDMVYNLMDNG